MKKTASALTIIAIVAAVATGFVSCKDKAAGPTQELSQPAPADSGTVVSPPGTLIGPEREEAMITSIAKLSNDYPTVMIEVDNGEVILKGTLEKSRVEKLLAALQNLEPKPRKVTNDLTIK
ncbi:MAG: hypothetical protein EOO09_04275 [Chitinophagaceae bacterium]|nr:MAG: hypothetical protein EOO09_04275 [Chitinophagaceae bacterium]